MTKSFLRSRNKEVKKNYEIEKKMMKDYLNFKEKANGNTVKYRGSV